MDLPRTNSAAIIFNFVGTIRNGSSKQHLANRWHKAFTIIFSYRVILSLPSKKLSLKKKENFSVVSRSPSYTSLYVQPQYDGSESSDANLSRKNGGFFLHLDPQAVAKIVREKDMDSLQLLGGIQGITAALETDAERGIHDNAEDLDRRKEVLELILFFG
eukprot:TRINITY_DN17431_c0_g2_i1.p1 TRINITY_DN17431_c0_g2~~TRINITY_DN17431_c0_g2_i1.p1  ORF type:complete len:160 (+),score=30.51 TRINITY_DN17431_c0_g2_i1:71-550(+)